MEKHGGWNGRTTEGTVEIVLRRTRSRFGENAAVLRCQTDCDAGISKLLPASQSV